MVSRSQKTAKVLMLDNYDSFTYNLVHYFEQLGCEMVVKRNDQTTLSAIEDIAPTHLVISPGPCDPDKAGLSLSVINRFKGVIPILGVCLGHQAIGQAFGGQVVRAKRPVHGKSSFISHTGNGIFNGLSTPFSVVRYHSLVLDIESLPSSLEVTAWTEDNKGDVEYIMGVRHKSLPIEGVQFHPESVLSEHGIQLLRNFLAKN